MAHEEVHDETNGWSKSERIATEKKFVVARGFISYHFCVSQAMHVNLQDTAVKLEHTFLNATKRTDK